MITIKNKPKSKKPSLKNIYIGQRPRQNISKQEIINCIVEDIQQGGDIKQAIIDDIQRNGPIREAIKRYL